MRQFASVVVAWILAGASVAPAAAQAWLTVGGADGSFKIEMPIPFDMPDPDGAITFACVHQTPELSLRFEVLNTPMTVSGQSANRGLSVDRIDDGSYVLQTRIYVVGHRTFRLIAHSTTEFEGDPTIQRFLTSVRLAD